MSKTGPKPTSAKVLQMRGSRYAKARMANEPGAHLAPASAPKPPEWLSDEARVVWKELVGQLRPLGVLLRADTFVLARYCSIFCQWRTAIKWLEQHGLALTSKGSRGIRMQMFPQARVVKGLGEELSRMEQALGMSPSARASLGVEIERGSQQGNDKEKQGKARFFND